MTGIIFKDSLDQVVDADNPLVLAPLADSMITTISVPAGSRLGKLTTTISSNAACTVSVGADNRINVHGVAVGTSTITVRDPSGVAATFVVNVAVAP